MTKRRDQRPFDMVQQHLSGLILNTILKIVEEVGDPYQVKPGLGGMTAYPPKAMAVICIMKEAEMRTYRKMTGYLRMNPDLVRKIGLSKIPSKSTMWRTCGMIPESYLREVHMRIIGGVMTGSLAGDSTGYSGNSLVRWFSIRHDQAMTKRGWIKLHSIIDISTRTILDYQVTDGYASDVTWMQPMLDRLDGGSGLFCLDSAYLARMICDAIADKGWTPRILPKSNTTCKNGGSQSWGEMTRTHRDDLDRFMDEYHQRSIIEAVFGAIKKMYGNHLRSRRRSRQNREVAIRVICYNIEVVARSDIKSGRLTHKSLAAMSA